MIAFIGVRMIATKTWSILKPVVSVFLVLMLFVFSAEAKTKHPVRKPKQKKAVPAVVKKTIRNSVFSTVVIDAGHGGHDIGGIPQNLIQEKGVALDVALRMNNALWVIDENTGIDIDGFGGLPGEVVTIKPGSRPPQPC